MDVAQILTELLDYFNTGPHTLNSPIQGNVTVNYQYFMYTNTDQPYLDIVITAHRYFDGYTKAKSILITNFTRIRDIVVLETHILLATFPLIPFFKKQ